MTFKSSIDKSKLEEKLGFGTISEWLSDFCFGDLAKSLVSRLSFSTKFEELQVFQEQIFEWKRLQTVRNELPQFDYSDISLLIKKIALQGGHLSEEEWAMFRKTLETIHQFQRLFDHPDTAELYHLRDLSFDIRLEKNLSKEINAVIDEDGKVKPNASPELREIRDQLFLEQNKLRKKLSSFLSNAQKEGMSDEDMTLTVRNGRLVVPLKAEYKRKIKGLVHDETSTGNIVFFEPEDALESNNYIRELEYAEKREIVKILLRLADKFKPHVHELQKALEWVAQLDFIQAKVKLANLLNANKPEIRNQPVLKLIKAFHPILFVHHSTVKKKIVPLSLELNEEHRLLIISGPNAGGKSVSLKTVGLLQYMFQCGLPVSCAEGSVFGIFEFVFADIGDSQSLENDLSTYSSHLHNLKYLTEKGGDKSLVLLDEFGAGTDPDYGGAIAEAILETISNMGCKGIVNTHYTNLKLFAQKQQGLVNAAMRFDPIKLEPLYELEIGKPGSSFALEIAQKIGLSPVIIELAKSKIGNNRLQEDHLLIELEKKKAELDDKKSKIENKEKALKEAIAQYEELKKLMQESRQRIINDAKQEAKEIITKANKLIENTIREIKESNAQKERTIELRKSLEQEVSSLQTLSAPTQQQPTSKEMSPISLGDSVRIVGQEAIGEVTAIKGDSFEVTWGDLKTIIKDSKLEKVSNRQLKKEQKAAPRPRLTGIDITDKMSKFRSEYDFRGLRADEALAALNNIMDDALLLGVSEFKIIHGKGDGILRQVLRKKLMEFKEVSGLNDEHPDRGGEGATIITMK